MQVISRCPDGRRLFVDNKDMQMLIRQAAPDDSPGLARVQVDSYRTAYRGIMPNAYLARFTYEEQEQDWRDLMAAAETSRVLYVALNTAGEVVGYAYAGPAGEPDTGAGELLALHVRRDWQGKGAGRRLIAATAAWLKQQGFTSMIVWVLAENTRARAIYEQLCGQPGAERSLHVEGLAVVEASYRWPDINVLLSRRS